MLSAQQKKKDNIAEYILYMWQVENLIRANNCDIELIRKNVLPSYSQQDEDTIKAIDEWWDNLTEMLKLENKEKDGHLQIIVNTLKDLNSLHLKLLETPKFLPYKLRFQALMPFLKELEAKTKPEPENDIELMLSAIYNAFLLRLKSEKISGATEQALREFASFLALLSAKYKEDQNGTLDFDHL